MKILLDTSVLVSAVLPTHDHYPDSSHCMAMAQQGSVTLCLAAHSLAETYAVLTRIPTRPRISPRAAWALTNQFLQFPQTQLVALTADQYAATIQDCVAVGNSGGTIYDAVIATAARNVEVDHLLTWNTRHFLRVWPTDVGCVLTPAEFLDIQAPAADAP